MTTSRAVVRSFGIGGSLSFAIRQGAAAGVKVTMFAPL
jgi:hypothetical protein